MSNYHLQGGVVVVPTVTSIGFSVTSTMVSTATPVVPSMTITRISWNYGKIWLPRHFPPFSFFSALVIFRRHNLI